MKTTWYCVSSEESDAKFLHVPSTAVFLNRRALASIYTGPREVLLEFVILVFYAVFMNKCFIVEIFSGEKYL